MIALIMGSAFLFGSLLLFGALGLLVEWIAYRMEVKERKKVRAAVFWENDLDEQAKKKLLREVYQREKQRHRASHLHDIEQSDRDFCLESDNYFDFVRGQMIW